MRQSWDVILLIKHYNTIILYMETSNGTEEEQCCVGVCEAEVVIRFGHGYPHITHLSQRAGVTNNSSRHKSAVVAVQIKNK